MQNEMSIASWRYWLGNDDAILVLRQIVSRAVSSTKQPPVTDAGLLEQSAPWEKPPATDSFSSGQLHGAASSNTRAVNYTEQSPAINSLAGTRTMVS